MNISAEQATLASTCLSLLCKQDHWVWLDLSSGRQTGTGTGMEGRGRGIVPQLGPRAEVTTETARPRGADPGAVTGAGIGERQTGPGITGSPRGGEQTGGKQTEESLIGGRLTGAGTGPGTETETGVNLTKTGAAGMTGTATAGGSPGTGTMTKRGRRMAMRSTDQRRHWPMGVLRKQTGTWLMAPRSQR